MTFNFPLYEFFFSYKEILILRIFIIKLMVICKQFSMFYFRQINYLLNPPKTQNCCDKPIFNTMKSCKIIIYGNLNESYEGLLEEHIAYFYS